MSSVSVVDVVLRSVNVDADTITECAGQVPEAARGGAERAEQALACSKTVTFIFLFPSYLALQASFARPDAFALN